MICFTAILGGFEELRPVVKPGNARWFAFTDHPPIDSIGWEVWPVPEPNDDPRRAARRYKTLCHRWFPDADVWLWLDGAVQLQVPPETVVEAFLDGADIGAFRHPSRDCAYAEAKRCIVKRKDSQPLLEGQMAAMQQAKFPRNWGLVETGLLARRNTEQTRELNDWWWQVIKAHSVRDQVSLPFACWQRGMVLRAEEGSLIKHPWIDYRSHAGR